MRLDLGEDPCARRVQIKATGRVEGIWSFIWLTPWIAKTARAIDGGLLN
jgi:hypothetical protein